MEMIDPTDLSVTIQDLPDGRVGLILDDSTMRGIGAILFSILRPEDTHIVKCARCFVETEGERIVKICEQYGLLAERRLKEIE